MVLTASYEARPFGVRSAMPLYRALDRCPDLVVVPPRFEAYREVSTQIRAVFARYSAVVEPLSLDEAYLDVTAPLRGGPSATRIAQHVRAEVRAETGLSATAGVSVNKFLAKLASGMNKPDGLTVVLPHQVDALLARLPVSDFHGIGPATAARLAAQGIHSGADLRAASPEALTAQFGKLGQHFWRIAHGQDDRPVEANRPHKSIGAEETYGDDLWGVDAVGARLPVLAGAVERRLERAGLAGRTVVLKLKFDDRSLLTRRVTVQTPVHAGAGLVRAVTPLLSADLLAGRGVRLAGITAASLCPVGERPAQPLLFSELEGGVCGWASEGVSASSQR